MTNEEIKIAAGKYARAAKGYLRRSGIDEKGYGYIGTPASAHIAEAINAQYHTAFKAQNADGYDVSFIIARDSKANVVAIDRNHMKAAINNIKGTAGALRRKVKFEAIQTSAEREKDEERDLHMEIRKAMRSKHIVL